MLNGRTGSKIRKKKTKIIPLTLEPEFNETLTFDLPFHQVDALQFIIILCSKVKSVDIFFKILKNIKYVMRIICEFNRFRKTKLK